MCRFEDSDCYCGVINDTCNQLLYKTCEAYKIKIKENKFIKISPNERILNLNSEEDKRLISEWAINNQDKLPSMHDLFKKS